MLTVHLSVQTEKELQEYCKQNNKTKTEVVEEALQLYLQQAFSSGTPYELGSDLFGLEGSKQTDLSATFKKGLKAKLNRKYSR
ncbi:MAG: ribbon-helix-helix protein, CopG family [Cyclobacteriaceae bacterium]